MNPNIEVINENLLGVNLHHVKLGWIKDIPILPGCNPEEREATLSTDGKLILNKAHPLYNTLKLFLPKIMVHSDQELQQNLQTMRDRTSERDTDGYERLYMAVMEWELKRRAVQRQYLRSIPKQSLFQKIKSKLKKGKRKA